MDYPHIFQLESVSYSYPDGRIALSDISLKIDRGDRLALLGANASGKSTLLHILDGLYSVSAGRMMAFGREIDDAILEDVEFRRFFRSEVALMFQNPDVQLFCGSVEEDIEFGPQQMGLPAEAVRQRVRDCASLCQIEHLLDRPPHALSGGEKKRVALASCLATNPSVLLLDEPTTGLDPRTEVWLMETLELLSQAGKTVVIATHDLGFAAEFTEHAIALSEEHTLAARGATQEIIGDQALLLRLNLIHSHAHRHGKTLHAHPHAHSFAHEHPHRDIQKESL